MPHDIEGTPITPVLAEAARTQPSIHLVFLREKYGLPDNWHLAEWMMGPPHAPEGMVKFRGYTCPLVKSGVRKGLPHWTKGDKAAARVFFESENEIAAWRELFANRIGKCVGCYVWGSGLAWSKWNRDLGTFVRKCRACDGTGLPPNLMRERASLLAASA